MIWFAFRNAPRDNVKPVLARLIKTPPLIEIVVNQVCFFPERQNAAQAAAHETEETTGVVVVKRINHAIFPIEHEVIDVQASAAIVAGGVDDVGIRKRARKAQLETDYFAQMKLCSIIFQLEGEQIGRAS